MRDKMGMPGLTETSYRDYATDSPQTNDSNQQQQKYSLITIFILLVNL